MPLDPISYSAVKKLEREIDKKVEEKLAEGVDTLRVNTISPNDSTVTLQGTIICNNLEPSADNAGTIGKSDKRYASIYVVNLYTGDIKLTNDWIITERDSDGSVIRNGVRILNDEGEEVFKITEDGIYFKGKKLKLVFEE